MTDFLIVALGASIAFAVMADVFLTTLYADGEGPIAGTIQRAIWTAALALGRVWHSKRRTFMGVAGPLMTALTLIAWIALLMVGFALVILPFLDQFRTDSGVRAETFMDALYFIGITVTVLGYGDIAPLTTAMRVISFVASGSGFILFTGALTYIIQLVTSIAERNQLALQVHDETAGTGSGVELVVRHLRVGDLERLKDRCDSWAMLVRQVQDKLHRFARATIYYRSADSVYDPEAAIRIVGEAAISSHMVACRPGWESLRVYAEHLDQAVSRLMTTVATRYGHPRLADDLAFPHITDNDREWVRRLDAGLRTGLPRQYRSDGIQDYRALELASRLRIFLTGLEAITHWGPEDEPRSQEHPPWRI